MQSEQEVFEITHSVERDNYNLRLTLANDPNQIQWFYGFSNMGNLIISMPVKGKVTSSSKRAEPKTMDDDTSERVKVGKS
jgi:hypothetical protein